MDPYHHRRYDLHHLLVTTTHTIAIVHIRLLSNRMVRLPIQFGHLDLQYSHVPLVNHIYHDLVHYRSLSLSTWGPACCLFSSIHFNHLILESLYLILITQYLQHYSLDWPLPHQQLYSNYVNYLYAQVSSIMTADLPCVSPLFCKIAVPKEAILSPNKFTINYLSASVI